MHTFASLPSRTHAVHATLASLLLLGAIACGEDTAPDGSVTPDPTLDGGAGDGSPGDGGAGDGSAADADLQDGSTGFAATQQTVHGTCEGELLRRDYPSTITITGLSIPDGTRVWGFVGFHTDESYDFCSVTGQAEVQGGSFQVAVMATTSGGYFPDVAFWIDEDGDGQCSLSETVFRTLAYGGPNGLTLELTAEEAEDDVENSERDTACEPFDALL